MDEDPVFYRRFGKILQESIDAYRAQRITEAEYLKRATDVMNSVLGRTGDQVPANLYGRDEAKAFYGVVAEVCDRPYGSKGLPPDVKADVAVKIDDIIRKKLVVDWPTNSDVQNEMRNDIDDLLYSVKADEKVSLTTDEMDAIVERALDIAKRRYPR